MNRNVRNLFLKIIVIQHKLNKSYTFVIFLLVILCCESCSQNVDDGIISNNIYSNQFFGVQIEIPYGWQVVNKNQKLNELDTSDNLLIKSNPWIRETINKSSDYSFVLLTLSKEPTDKNKGPNLICIAEKIDKSLPIVSSYGYLEHAKSNLSRINLGPHKHEISICPNPTAIDGRKFEVLESKMKFPKSVINQKYFARLKKPYALVFVLTSCEQEPKKDFEAMLSTIKFNQ